MISTYKTALDRVAKYSLLALTLAFVSPCVFSTPLVNTAEVLAWKQGSVSTLHCRVVTPHVYQVSSQGEARLKWVLPVDSHVEKGQLIAEQDPFYLKREIQQLRIDIQSARVSAEFSQKEYERQHSVGKNLVSQSLLAELSTKTTQAILNQQRLEEQLKIAQYRLDRLQHFAPTTGQILSLQAIPGEQLTIGQAIMAVQPSNEKELACELPVSQYRQSNGLANTQFQLSGSISLKLGRSSQIFNENAQVLRIILKAEPEKMADLLIGERLEVSMSNPIPGLSRIPLDALEVAENSNYVWQLMADNTVKKLAVNIVSTQDSFFVISSSLLPGDKVITMGRKGLENAQRVKPVSSFNKPEPTDKQPETLS